MLIRTKLASICLFVYFAVGCSKGGVGAAGDERLEDIDPVAIGRIMKAANDDFEASHKVIGRPSNDVRKELGDAGFACALGKQVSMKDTDTEIGCRRVGGTPNCRVEVVVLRASESLAVGGASTVRHSLYYCVVGMSH